MQLEDTAMYQWGMQADGQLDSVVNSERIHPFTVHCTLCNSPWITQ